MSSLKNNTPSPKSIAQILKELSDALEELAYIIAQQKIADQAQPVRKIKVLTDKIKSLRPQPPATAAEENPEEALKKAYRKNFLREWLINKNVHIGKALDNISVQDKLYQTAAYLAEHYNNLEDFYKELKRKQVRKIEEFKYVGTVSSMRYIRKWAEMLVQNKLLDAFEPLNELGIEVDTALIKEATAFINGMWLEIYLRRQIVNFLERNYRHINAFDVLSDLHVTFPNGKSGEIDLLLMLNGQVFWFECKSGQIGNEYYEKYAYVNHRVLQLPEGYAFLVIPQMRMHQPQEIKGRTGMIPIFATDLDDYLDYALKKAL